MMMMMRKAQEKKKDNCEKCAFFKTCFMYDARFSFFMDIKIS